MLLLIRVDDIRTSWLLLPTSADDEKVPFFFPVWFVDLGVKNVRREVVAPRSVMVDGLLLQRRAEETVDLVAAAWSIMLRSK